MRNSLVGLIALVGLLASGAAQAGVSRCEGCTSAQFQARAKSMGLGTHTITSLSTNVIKRYYVFDRNGGEPNTPTRLAATEMGVPSDLRGIFAAAVGFHQVTNGTMRAVVEVRADQLGVGGAGDATAYDVMSDFSLKNRIADRIAQGQLPGVVPKLNAALSALAQGLFAFIGMSDGTVEVTVRTVDGGIVVFAVRAGVGSAEYLEGRSRTADGQPIPEENSRKYAGTWYGNGVQGYDGDLAQFAHYMEQLGAKITVGTVTVREAGSLLCTWTPPTLTCEPKRN